MEKKIALYTTCRRPNHPMSLATPMNRMLPTPLRSRKRSSVDPGPTVMRSSDMVSPMPLGASSAALLRGRQLTAGGRHSMTGSLAGDMGLMWRGGEEESTGNAVEMFVGDNWSLLLGLAVWVCSFVLLALVVFLVYPAVPDTQCSQPACLRLDRALASSLSARRHPCDDFFAYVCPATRADRKARVLLQESEFDAVMERALSDDSMFRGLGKMREDCLRYRSTGSVRSMDILHAMHRHMGLAGWPVSAPALPPEGLFNLIAKLDFEYRVGAWARLYVESDGTHALRTLVDSPALLPHWFEDESAQEQYATQALAMFGARADAAHEVVRLERAIHAVNAKSEGRFRPLTLEAAAASLNGVLKASQWTDTMSRYLGTSRARVSFKDVIFRVLGVLLATPPLGFLYLGYRALAMFGFDAHDPHWAAHADAPAVWLPPDQRIGHCHQLLWSANPTALNAALVMRKQAKATFAKSDTLDARAVVNLIKDELQTRLVDHMGLDEATFTEARKKLEALNVTLPGDYASTRPLTPMLSNSSLWVPRRATPFLLNVLSLRALSAPFLLGALTRPVPAGEKDAMLHLVQQRLTEPLVKLQRNAVGVPLGALTPLLFHEDFPAAVRFAGLGRAFVDAALRVVGPEGEFYDQKGQRVRSSWWTEKSHESFRNATRCLGLPGSEELWRAALSVRLSWDVFRARRVDDRVGGLKTGLPSEGDADRLFFVAYCFFLCAREERPERHVHGATVPRDLFATL
ncbi:phosphate-regulating neutral endopeptidase PHEX-like [Amblyomma americanum]